MSDLISIIVPAYNAEKTITNCINSLIQQTYPDFEAIIVDDGSKDHTLELIQKFAQTDRRIRCLHQENSGQSSARNLALEHMRGQYFMFVDSDDAVKPGMLKKLYQQIKQTDADIAMCGMIYKTSGKEIERYCREDIVMESREAILKGFLSERFVFGPMCKLFDVSKFKAIRFQEGIIFEDIEMLSRAYFMCSRVSISSYAGYVYYVRQGSTTHSSFDEKKLDLLKVTDSIVNRMLNSHLSCKKELQLFVLNNYLTVLLLAADTGDLSQYESVCRPLTMWIRENIDQIERNDLIPKQKKIYAKIFCKNHQLAIKVLSSLRRHLQ